MSLQRRRQQQRHVRACNCPPLPSKPARSGGLQGAEMLQEVAAVACHCPPLPATAQ